MTVVAVTPIVVTSSVVVAPVVVAGIIRPGPGFRPPAGVDGIPRVSVLSHTPSYVDVVAVRDVG
jgi:hypothetical protein